MRKYPTNLNINVSSTYFSVYNKQDQISLIYCNFSLELNSFIDLVIRLGNYTTCVHQNKSMTRPFCFFIFSVSGYTFFRIYDSSSLTADPVKQRRFAYIRSSYNCDYIFLHITLTITKSEVNLSTTMNLSIKLM